MKRRVTFVAGTVVGLALAAAPSAPAQVQSRVVVPIVIQAPRPTVAPGASTPSVAVTTRTLSPRPGLTTTHVTVENTTGRALGVLPPPRVGARAPAPTPPMAGMALPPNVTRSRITLQDATGDAPGAPGRVGVPVGTGAPDRAPVTVEVTQWQTGLGRQHVSITTDGPIDAPIVILAP